MNALDATFLQQTGELSYEWLMFKKMQPRVVLEIGSLRGGWLFVMAGACNRQTHLVGVNPESNDAQRRVASELEREGHRADFIIGDSHSPATLERVREILGTEKVVAEGFRKQCEVNGNQNVDLAVLKTKIFIGAALVSLVASPLAAALTVGVIKVFFKGS